MNILLSVIRYYECFNQNNPHCACAINMTYVLVNVPGYMHCYCSIFCPLLTCRPLSLLEAPPVFSLYILHERQELILYDSVWKSCRKRIQFCLCFLGYKVFNTTLMKSHSIFRWASDTDQQYWQQTAISSRISNMSWLFSFWLPLWSWFRRKWILPLTSETY